MSAVTKGRKALDAKQTARAVDLYARQGLMIGVIAQRFGISPAALRRILRQAGCDLDNVETRAYADAGRRVVAVAGGQPKRQENVAVASGQPKRQEKSA